MITMDKSNEEFYSSDVEQNFFRDLVETAQDLFWQCDLDGRYTYLNKAWEEHLGYRTGEMIGHKFTEFQNKDYADQDWIELENLLRHGSTYHYETEYISKTGEIVNLIFSGKAMRNKQGQTIGAMGSAYNSTNYKKTLNALEKSEELFRSFFKYSPIGINVFDLRGKVIAVNSTARGYFGVSEDDPLSKYCLFDDPSITDQTKWKIRNGQVATEARYIDFKAIKSHKMYVTSKDESNRVFVKLTYAPYGPDLADPIGFVVIIQNLTDIKELEEERLLSERHLQQMQKLESLGVLAGGIAHDFNNILGIILGNIELAMDDVTDWNPASQNLDEVKKACIRAKDVVRQILSFSRKSEVVQKEINLASVVVESLKLIRVSIPTSIDIRHNISKDINDIFGDPTQIHQIMINLCTNAAHAMENEGGILEVTLRNIEISEDTKSQYSALNYGPHVHLRVSDTGDGISPEMIDRIFDPYFTTKDVGKGSGMGLAVVHGIVKNHHGEISVESETGKGTVFNILFPAVQGHAKDESEDGQEPPTGNERILFVDDEASLVNLNQQRLERLGYKVIPKTDPSEALDFFRTNPDQIDLIITDMAMPHMTGEKLAQEILNIVPEMPIILCTGYSERMSEDRAQELGIRKYIEKPFGRERLAISVREVLDGL